MPRDSCTASFPFAHLHDEINDNHYGATASPSSANCLHSEGASLSEVETSALHALKEELSRIPHEEKSSLVHVQRVQPDLVDDDHMISFLHSEDFDVSLALKRLVRYWEHRYKVFGPDNFALPMTLRGAMKDHIPALKEGLMHLLPVLDGAGRAIIYSNSSSRAPSNLQTEEKIQVWWYLLHVAMENPSVTKKGFIILANSKNSRLNNFDGKWTLAASYSGDRDFPIRWRMAHCCHANAVFPLVASAVKAVLSLEQRKSFLLHNGSNERVLDSLSEYFLPIHCIPTDLGGSLHVVSTDAFVQERLAIEGGASDIDKISQVISSTSQSAGILADGPLQVINITETTCNGLSNPQIVGKACSNMPSEMNRYDDLKSESQSIEAEYATTKSIVPNNNATTSPIPEKDMENSACQKLPAEQKRKSNESNLGNERKSQSTKKAGKGATHPGRIGDSRMNRAVQAKIDYPNLSLVAALVAGGFVFPDLDVPGMKLSTVKDTDNVTVYQRRNQLLRRLRLVREKSNKT